MPSQKDQLDRSYKYRMSYLLCVFIVLMWVLVSPVVSQAAKSKNKISPVDKEFVKAVQRNDLQRVKALLADGVDANINISNMPAIMIARTPEMVSLLATAGADVNARSELLKQTVLMSAVSQGKPEIVKALIDAGADVNARDDKSGMTALSVIIMNRGKKSKIEIIKLLLDAGADPNVQFLDMPLLSLSAMSGDAEVMKALIDGGADIHAKNKQGATPLMVAVSSGRTEAAQLLIDHGADVNQEAGEASGERKKRGNQATGGTAMDMAGLMGDSEMMALLGKSGAKESSKLPEPDSTQPNTPGMYRLTCKLTGSPPPQGRKFSCSSIGQIAKSGTETAIFSQAFFDGKHQVPLKKGCLVDLGQPGSYTISTTRVVTPWDLVCRARLGTTSGGKNWIAYIEKKKPVIEKTEHSISVKEAEKIAGGDEKDPPSIKIIKPLNEEQFVFDDVDPGALEIDAEAEIKGDCSDAASWTMEDIGKSKKKLDPEGQSNNVTIGFTGLPMDNSHFGKKKITASACGKSDSIVVDVFFSPFKRNHPGKGSGKTPNWFYYWTQTKAGSGFKPDYAPVKIATDGTPAVGQYDYTADKVFLTDKIMKSSCAARVAALGGKQSRGIDCYAETVRHETHHQKERWEWWGSIDPTSLPGSARRAYDADSDLVPNKIENKLKRLKNCNEADPTSCDGRPKKTLFDIEMDAYWIGWEWPVGSANTEDWSWCGKQWKSIAECPDKMRW